MSPFLRVLGFQLLLISFHPIVFEVIRFVTLSFQVRAIYQFLKSFFGSVASAMVFAICLDLEQIVAVILAVDLVFYGLDPKLVQGSISNVAPLMEFTMSMELSEIMVGWLLSKQEL